MSLGVGFTIVNKSITNCSQVYATFALSFGLLFLAGCHFLLSTGSAHRELSISYGRKERSALAHLQRIG